MFLPIASIASLTQRLLITDLRCQPSVSPVLPEDRERNKKKLSRLEIPTYQLTKADNPPTQTQILTETLEAIASRLEAIDSGLEAIATRLEAITTI